jgi:hypothetical protein
MLRTSLTDLLHLTPAPVAIAFLDAAPQGVSAAPVTPDVVLVRGNWRAELRNLVDGEPIAPRM